MLLLILVLIPFVFGILSWQSVRINEWMPRWLALCGTMLIFIIVLFLWLCNVGYLQEVASDYLVMNRHSKWKLEYLCRWIPKFGIHFHLALDGLSMLMLMLSGMLGTLSVISSWNTICNRYSGLFYLNLLWVLGGVIGVFLAMDMFLLFLFWEIILIPMYFLISLWGYKELDSNSRVDAAIKFFIYTQLSGLLILIPIIVLAFFNYNINGMWSFDYENFLKLMLPNNVEYLLMLCFFLAFAIKMPIVPFHVWLPATNHYSPVSGSVDLIGILLKTAVYGFFRFTLPLFPNASQTFIPIAMFLGILNIFYGACMAFVQTNIKRFIAYTNISHMGFLLIAIYSNNQLSYQGAVVHMIACSLSASGMFIICGQLYNRFNTFNITEVGGGLWSHIKLMPALSLFFIVSMIGIPGTGNFIGEIVILFGVFQHTPIVAILAAFGILFISICFLILMQRIYYGKALEARDIKVYRNMTFNEKFALIVLLLCLVVIGLYPQFIINTSHITMQNIYIRLQLFNRV